MSGLMFESDIQGVLADHAAGKFAPPEPEAPGYLSVIGQGLMRGGVGAARGAALAVTPFVPWGNEEDPQAFLKSDHILPRKEDFFKFVDENLTEARQYWTPDPGTLNLSQKIIGGLAELPLRLTGGGNLMAVSSALETGTDLVQSGVDATAAAVVGGISGAALKGMMAIPQAGETLKQTIGLATANPLIGILQRYGTREGLEAAGYPEQAKNFDPFDPVAMITDTVLGGVFATTGYRSMKYTREARAEVTKLADRWQEIQDALPVEVVDSAHVMGTWFKALETNPHNETVRGAVEVHLAAMDKALSDLQAGKPVDIGREVKSLFGPDYATPTAEAFRGMLRDVWGQNEDQTDAALALANGFASYKGMHLDDWINKYIAGGEAREPVGGAFLQEHILQKIVPKVADTQPAQMRALGEAADTTAWRKERTREIWETEFKPTDENPSRNVVPRDDFDIIVTNSGLKHNQAFSGDIRKMLILDDLRDVLSRAVYVASEKPDSRKVNKPNITAYHKLLMPVRFGDELALAKITLQQDDKGRVFYDSSLENIEIEKPADGTSGVSTGKPESHSTDIQQALTKSIVKLFDTKSNTLFQDAHGAVSFLNDGRAVLHALKNPNISTVMHELAHVWRRQLDPEDLAVVAEFYADPNGKWSRSGEERFARAFEKYLSDGKAPSEKLKDAFDKFKTWLTDIYRGIVGSPLEGQIPNRVRDVFDKMLTRERTPEEVAYQEAAVEVLAEEAAKGGGDPWPRRNPEAAGRSAEVAADTVGAVRESPLPPEPDRPPNDWFPSDDVPDLTPPSQRLTRGRNNAETIEQAIIRLGGINRDQAYSQWGATLSEGQRARMYKKNGLPIDRITEALAEEGFLPLDEHGKPVVGSLEDALARSLAGEDVFSSNVTDRQLDSRAAAAEAEYARRQGPGEQMTDAEYEALAAKMWAEDNADPLSRHVNSIMEQRGDFPLYTETTADNQQRTVTAREALESAQREIDTAKKSRDLYEAAANCLWMS